MIAKPRTASTAKPIRPSAAWSQMRGGSRETNSKKPGRLPFTAAPTSSRSPRPPGKPISSCMSRYCGTFMPLLVPCALRMLPGLPHRLGGDAEAQPRINREIEAPFLQRAGFDPRRLAELDHVGEQRLLDLATDALELGLAFRRFHEDHVGAGLLVELGAAQRLVQAMSGAGIGAGHDHCRRIAPRLDRDLDLEHHVLGRHDAAAGRMAALLRHLLVLDLDRGDARRLVAAHRALHVQQPAIAGVGVGDQRRVDHRADHLGAAHHVGIGREARVGQAEHRGGRAIAGHVERRKAHLVGDPRRDAVVDAGRQDELALGQPFAQRARLHIARHADPSSASG